MTKIQESAIPLIEEALGFKLYENQKTWILNKGALTGGRASGKTTALCITLALSEGEPLDLRRPWEFSDGAHLGWYQKSYSLRFFRHYFMEIREKLKNHGFKVRDVREPVKSRREIFTTRMRNLGYQVLEDPDPNFIRVMLRTNRGYAAYHKVDILTIEEVQDINVVIDSLVAEFNHMIVRDL